MPEKITAANQKSLYHSENPPFPPAKGFDLNRRLVDGDWVVLNRKPSLHRESILSHRIKVHKGETLTLRLSATVSYLADFDGDEMNLFVPQTVQSNVEARELLAFEKHLISPKKGLPMTGAVQNVLLGSTLLSRKDTFLTREKFYNLALPGQWEDDQSDKNKKRGIPIPAILKPRILWTGKQVHSLALPSFVNYTCKGKEFETIEQSLRSTASPHEKLILDDFRVLIRKGNLLTGPLEANSLGALRSGSLLDSILKDPFTPEDPNTAVMEYLKELRFNRKRSHVRLFPFPT